MQNKAKPVILLVHGAWHTPKHFESFIQQLKSEGYEVECPLLPSCDEAARASGAVSNLYVDAEAVRKVVKSLVHDKGRDVIMLMHSYGGLAGQESLKERTTSEKEGEEKGEDHIMFLKQDRRVAGLAGGVIHLIYMCAFLLRPGWSVVTANTPEPDPPRLQADESTGTIFFCQDPIQLLFSGVEPPELAQKMVALLVPMTLQSFLDSVTHPAWQHTPCTYLRAEEDKIFFTYWQDQQIQAVRDSGVHVNVKSYKSGHAMFLTIPGEIIKTVNQCWDSEAK